MSKIFGQALLDDMVRTDSLPMPLVKQAAKEILVVIREGLVRDGVVKISNFGTFRLKPVAARRGVNPQTGETITIPAQQRVIFSPCKALRDLIQPIYHPPQPIEQEPDVKEHAPKNTAVPSPVLEDSLQTHAVAQGSVNQPVEEPAVAPLSRPPVPSLVVTPHEVIEEPVTTVPDAQPVTTSLATHPVPEPKPHESETASELLKETNDSQQDAPKETSETPTETVVIQQHRASSAPPLSQTSTPEEETSNHPIQARTEENKSRSSRIYPISAAVVLLIALVGAGLLIESETDGSAPSHEVEASVTIAPPEVVTTASLAENDATTLVTTPDVSSPPAAPPVDERDDTLDTSVTEESAATEMVAVSDENPLVPHNDVAPAMKSVSPALSPTTEYYFVEQSHEIANGESLWRLAKNHYQDPLLWPHIYQANNSIIDNPDHLLVGSTISIPGLQGSPDRLTKFDRHQIAEGYYLAYLHYKKIGREDALFALLEAKRYDSSVVEEYRSVMQLSQAEELQLAQQQTMPF